LSFATNSKSPSPAFDLLAVDVEKAAAHCVRAGFHADCNREVCRKADVRAAEFVNRETARGAEREKHLMEIMIGDMKIGFLRRILEESWMVIVQNRA